MLDSPTWHVPKLHTWNQLRNWTPLNWCFERYFYTKFFPKAMGPCPWVASLDKFQLLFVAMQLPSHEVTPRARCPGKRGPDMRLAWAPWGCHKLHVWFPPKFDIPQMAMWKLTLYVPPLSHCWESTYLATNTYAIGAWGVSVCPEFQAFTPDSKSEYLNALMKFYFIKK